MKIYNELKSLRFFEWLSETHNLSDTDMKPEYLDELPLNDIHRTVCNSMAFRWFRENCDWPIETWIQPYLSINPRTYEGLYWRRGETESVGIYDTYEEAELACLIKLIETVKTKQP